MTAAVSHHLGTDHAPDALLAELMGVIREEKGVVRPVRPHLVRALAAVGGHSRDESGDEELTVTVTKNRTEGVARGGTPPPRGRSWPPRSSAGRCACRR